MDDLITTAGGLAGTGRARPDPLAYNAQRVFQHYPTRMLDDGDVIRLTAFGKCWLAGDVPGDPVKPIAAPYFDLALEPAAQVVQQRGGAMAVGELVAALRQSDQTDMVARAAVGRLQKYGIFAIEAPGASRDPGATAQALSVAASTAEA